MGGVFSWQVIKKGMLLTACGFALSLSADDSVHDSTTQQNNAEPAKKTESKECPTCMACPTCTETLTACAKPVPPESNVSPKEKAAIATLDTDEDPPIPPEATPQEPAAPQKIAASEPSTSTQPTPAAPQAQTATPIEQEATITENRDGGKFLTLDNGQTFEVPTVLKRKAANWQLGDKVVVEKGSGEHWYKLYNETRNEKMRARIKTTPPQSK